MFLAIAFSITFLKIGVSAPNAPREMLIIATSSLTAAAIASIPWVIVDQATSSLPALMSVSATALSLTPATPT